MNIREGGNNLFISHQNADPDAIASLYMLWVRYGGTIGLPNPPDSMGRRLMEHLDMEPVIAPDPGDYELVVVVDTPDPRQLEPMVLPDEGVIVIDHHRVALWEREVIYEDRRSCAEIIYDMIKPEDLSSREATAMVAGMLSDTSNFRRADHLTFKTLWEVMSRSGVTVTQVRNILQRPRTYSEKICRLKGASRSTHERVNGYLIACSHVSSFESSVCNMLLLAGADIAFVASQRNDDILVSARVTSELVEEGFDLGLLFHRISSAFHGITGGGHPGAGVLRGKGDADDVLVSMLEETRALIQKEGLERLRD